MRTPAALACLALLAACGEADPVPSQAQRVPLELANAGGNFEASAQVESDGANWQVTEDGRGIRFGPAEGAPLLTLACRLEDENAPQLAIIRHVVSPPGAKALFAVLGNGVNARLKLDAKLVGNEWRWEGNYPADDPLLDVFTGPRRITATLPGGGMLEIAGSELPREFVNWCRAGGRTAKAAETAGEAED